MSEYWKSTPNYWCTHCKIYVRDSKLSRANHDVTPKHQSAIKRQLSNIHREHEQQLRDSERAKREVERLNGVVSSRGDGAQSGTGQPLGGGGGATSTQAERQRQLEQLAGLGVNIAAPLRQDVAMAGEWTVSSTRVIKDDDEEDTKDGKTPLEAKAVGVRKRELEKTEEEQEEEAAVKGLFKKPRQWGRDSKTAPGEEDTDLDALLSGPLALPAVKAEPGLRDTKAEKEPKLEEAEDGQQIKEEEDTTADQSQKIAPGLGEDTMEAAAEALPPVLFKKRKPKNNRQK